MSTNLRRGGALGLSGSSGVGQSSRPTISSARPDCLTDYSRHLYASDTDRRTRGDRSGYAATTHITGLERTSSLHPITASRPSGPRHDPLCVSPRLVRSSPTSCRQHSESRRLSSSVGCTLDTRERLSFATRPSLFRQPTHTLSTSHIAPRVRGPHARTRAWAIVSIYATQAQQHALLIAIAASGWRSSRTASADLLPSFCSSHHVPLGINTDFVHLIHGALVSSTDVAWGIGLTPRGHRVSRSASSPTLCLSYQRYPESLRCCSLLPLAIQSFLFLVVIDSHLSFSTHFLWPCFLLSSTLLRSPFPFPFVLSLISLGVAD